MKNIEQAFNNIDSALKQINTSRDNHIILAQNLSFLKSKADECEDLKHKVEELEALLKADQA